MLLELDYIPVLKAIASIRWHSFQLLNVVLLSLFPFLLQVMLKDVLLLASRYFTILYSFSLNAYNLGVWVGGIGIRLYDPFEGISFEGLLPSGVAGL